MKIVGAVKRKIASAGHRYWQFNLDFGAERNCYQLELLEVEGGFSVEETDPSSYIAGKIELDSSSSLMTDGDLDSQYRLPEGDLLTFDAGVDILPKFFRVAIDTSLVNFGLSYSDDNVQYTSTSVSTPTYVSRNEFTAENYMTIGY